MQLDIYLKIITSWEFLAILGFVVILFPLLFTIASLDKSPVKIKKVPVSRKKPAPPKKAAPAAEDEEADDEDE